MCYERTYLWDVLLVVHVGWGPVSNWYDRSTTETVDTVKVGWKY